jgi:acyl dehydratase
MPFDYETLCNWPIPVATQSYSARDTILYALGVGAAMSNPVPADDLKFVFEQNLAALPTMGAVLATGPFWMQDPATGIDWKRILHGEQMLTVHKPLPPQGTVRAVSTVDEIYDKGADKGAVMYLSRRLFDASSDAGRGELLMTIRSACFMRGNGGFGGRADGAPKPQVVPDERAPDLMLDLSTRPEQAAIYRLSGDDNPLHIDPAVARAANFERPILHGLCTYGVAGRAVLKLLCGNEPARLRRLDVRFANPLFPGETIRTEVWREGRGRAAFKARAVERDVVVINNGLAEFEE